MTILAFYSFSKQISNKESKLPTYISHLRKKNSNAVSTLRRQYFTKSVSLQLTSTRVLGNLLAEYSASPALVMMTVCCRLSAETGRRSARDRKA